MMRQRCIANGTIQAGQIVYASQLGGHYVTSANVNPKDNPPFGVALNKKFAADAFDDSIANAEAAIAKLILGGPKP